MRNLKRVLTMVMAIAMMISLMTIGAGAAFPDQDKVKNTDAVNMNVALNIIKGRDDGKFDPAGNVTRGEMAKMICVLLNGGNEPTLGTKPTPVFTDIKGHWSEKYIEYCASLGIIAGMGDGTFAPDGKVTGTQAAKMLLVALGYDAAFEGFNGASWSVKINVAANQKNLFEDISIDPNAALNRDNAAQMVWNALQAMEVKYTYSLTTVNGQLQNVQVREDKTSSLVATKYKAVSDYSAVMTAYQWNTSDKKFVYTLADGKTFKTTTDYSALFGMDVKVVYKDNTDKTVYGMYADDSAVLATGCIADFDSFDTTDKSVKIDGTKYKYDEGTGADATKLAFVAENQLGTKSYQNTTAGIAALKAYQFKAIDVDGNDKIDYIVYLPFTVAEVTYAGTKSITMTTDNGNTFASAKFEDDNIAKGIEKGDFVKVIREENTAYTGVNVSELTTITGAVTATKSSGGTDKVQVNATWYTLSGANIDLGDFNLNDKYTIYTVGNYAFYASEGANKTVKDIAFVASTDNSSINGNQAKLYFADGTSLVVSVDDMYNAAGADANLADLNKMMVSFEKDGSDYDLTLIGAANDCGFDGYAQAVGDNTNTITAATTNKTGKLDYNGTAYAIADDAVVFILDGNNKVKVVTGKTANSYKSALAADDTAGAVVSSLIYNTKNGVKTAQVAMLVTDATDLPNSQGTSDNYAVVMGGVSVVKVDGTTYQSYDIWNGTATVTVIEKGTASVAAEGKIIKYTDLGDKKVDDVVLVSSLAGTAGYYAVDGISSNDLYLVSASGGDNKITANAAGDVSGAYTTVPFCTTKDTVILFVDTDADEGFKEGAIQTAKENFANGHYNYNTNVFVYDEATTDGELDLIVVDINNEWN